MNPVEDGFVSHGQLVWIAASGRVSTARALQISLPSLETATSGYCASLESELGTLVRMLPREMLLQAIWLRDDDFSEALERYYQDTLRPEVTCWPERERNAVFVTQTEQARAGRLRGERLFLILQAPLPGGRRALDDLSLEAAGKGFDLWLGQIREAVGRLGGLADEPDQGELFALIRSHTDPGALQKRDIEPSPDHSLWEAFPGDMIGLEGLGFYCGGRYHGMVAMADLPRMTCSGIMAHLLGQPLLDYSIAVNLRSLDPARELETAEAERAKLEQARLSSRQKRLDHSAAMLAERIRALAAGEVHPVKFQFVLRVSAETQDELRARLAALRSAVARMQGARGYEVVLPVTARNLFLATLPGAPLHEPAFWLKSDDLTAANLLPLAGDARRSLTGAQAIFPAAGSGLLGLRLFAGEGGHGSPQHAFVTGMTGSGKSAFLIALLTQTDPFAGYTAIIDDGLSYVALTLVLTSGRVSPLVLAVDGADTLNVWDTGGSPLGPRHCADVVATLHLMAGTKESGDGDRLRSAVLSRCVRRFCEAHAAKWLDAKSGRRELLGTLARAVRNFSRENGIGEDTVENYARFRERLREDPDYSVHFLTGGEGHAASPEEITALAFARMRPREMPVHSLFHDWLEAEAANASRDRTEMETLVSLLEGWRADRGARGVLLDGYNTVSLAAAHVHIELGRLGAADPGLKAIAAHIISAKVREEIVRRPRSERKRVVIEELGGFLGLPGGEAMVNEFYQRMRKFNTWVVSVIQQISSLPLSMAVSIIGNTRQAFLFRQKEERDLEALREAFRLPDAAIEILRRFREPDAAAGAPFLCWEDLGGRARITAASNRATREMLYVSSSSGELFEERKRALASAPDILEAVIREANRN